MYVIYVTWDMTSKSSSGPLQGVETDHMDLAKNNPQQNAACSFNQRLTHEERRSKQNLAAYVP